MYREPPRPRSKTVKKTLLLTRIEVHKILSTELKRRGILPTEPEQGQFTIAMAALQQDDLDGRTSLTSKWNDDPAVRYTWTEQLPED
jgi:hypothetical protein